MICARNSSLPLAAYQLRVMKYISHTEAKF